MSLTETEEADLFHPCLPKRGYSESLSSVGQSSSSFAKSYSCQGFGASNRRGRHARTFGNPDRSKFTRLSLCLFQLLDFRCGNRVLVSDLAILHGLFFLDSNPHPSGGP